MNNWKEVSAEGEAQKELKKKIIENFEPQENIILQELDAENSSWTYLRTFELFFDDKLIELIVEMTNQYALEKGAVAWTLVDKETIRSFIAVLILSGYVQLPSYRMFWEEAPDVQHQIVKNAMPRNRLVAILQNLHCCDNTTIDPTDKCGKVRPLLDMVRDNLRKHAKLTKCLNIDESMIPYYGKFGQTQNRECLLNQFDLDTKSGACIFREGISTILKYIKAKDPRINFLTNLV